MKNKLSNSPFLPLALILLLASLVAFLLPTPSSNAYITGSPGVLAVDGTAVVTPVTTITNDYNVLATDQFIKVVATNKSITIDSAGAATKAIGHELIVKNMSTGTNTIIASGGLEGGSTYTLTNQYATVHLKSDGTYWWVVSHQ